ncbi:MAG TPA: STAS domain-containing protein [Terriglobales bacterium]|nr:STAS domain-containing protein [Terriglobales bacterium]
MVDNRAFTLEQHPGGVPESTVFSISGPMVIEHLFKFQEAWRANQSPLLIFELGGVSYMDSSLIGSLVNAHVHLAKTGRKMALAAVPDRIKQMLAVTNVDSLFKFYPTVADAESALSAAKAQAG